MPPLTLEKQWLIGAILLSLLLFIYTPCTFIAFLVAHGILYCVIYRDRVIICLKTLSRDVKGMKILFILRFEINKRLREKKTIGQIFSEEIVVKHPDKVALVDVERKIQWTFRELESYSNQVANYFQDVVGLKPGDSVSLFMNNCPEYAALWLGLSKIGVRTALINFNLKLESLGHCLKVADSKMLISGADLQTAIEDAINHGHIDHNTPLYVWGEVAPSLKGNNLAELVKQSSKLYPIVDAKLDIKDTLFYIFTSGTTGLPKAALITHARYYFMSRGAGVSFDMTHNERIYISMPLYHTAAGILGLGQVLLWGCTAVIRKKFSASRFWDECIEYDCTSAQYIGEMCRYLLAQPFRDNESKHSLKLMFGNGLRPQIWEEFVRRFRIPRIGEFYGSTEGNTSLINVDNKTGACGFFPTYQFLSMIYPVCLIKVDEITGEIIRDKKGLCIRCAPGSTGMMVGRIVRGDPLKDFTGYVSGADTEKKVIRDVFVKGDYAFSSGDVLHLDICGYLYFRDRTGDTFRWKGENVSTSEIESVLHRMLGLADATVYGVDVPGHEGRAGMAAIVDQGDNVNLTDLNARLRSNLPVYARPVFIRVCKQVDKTGTYKLQKTALQKDGFEPSKVGDNALFYMNSKSGQYETLTNDVHKLILDSNIHL